MNLRKLFSVFALATISGCGLMAVAPESESVKATTLADLKPAALPQPTASRVSVLELQDIEQRYKRAYAVEDNPEVKLAIGHRLAGLAILRNEKSQLDSEEAGRYFDESIALYEDAIEKQSDPQKKDDLMYQLAKAYDMDGRSTEASAVLAAIAVNHPDSENSVEVEFRRAERFFSMGNYSAAEESYLKVIAAGSGNFYENSLYMLGWSRFKQNDFKGALKPYTQVLDLLLQGQSDLQQLDNSSKKSMAEDTLRVMSLAFSYLGGAGQIEMAYEGFGERPYMPLIYANLGELYAGQERYIDASETYSAFVRRYPQADEAPDFSVKIIAVYLQGNYPSQILPAKELYVNSYGIRSSYWALKGRVQRDKIKPVLRQYINEISSYYHADTQALNQSLLEASQQNKKASLTQEALQQRYLLVADWYAQYIETFPTDKNTSEKRFLMAEALYDARAYPQSISAYEQVAYVDKDLKYGAQAGFSAILTYRQYQQTLDDELTIKNWQRREIDSSLRFVEVYPYHKESSLVLTRSAQLLLEQKRYEEAVLVATKLVGWEPQPSQDSLRSAWLVIGVSEFELLHYENSEEAYKQVLLLPEDTVISYDDVRERQAASVFKQGEMHLFYDEKSLAIDDFLRVRQIQPNSEIAIKGMYDGGTYLMDLQQWQDAERVFSDFRRLYPEHSLSQTLEPKMITVYQKTGQWGLAAVELLALVEVSEDPEVARSSLYLAAEYFEKSGNQNEAIRLYRDYAHKYPEPYAIVLEARFKLSELYAVQNSQEKRNFWLAKIISGDAAVKGSSERSDRSIFLAAMASVELADQNYTQYERIKLTLPLKKSLKNKKSALDKTIKAYQKVLSYGVAEFTTQASHRIGEVYHTLSRDLIESQRPKGLDELALEQYEILLEEQAYPFEDKAIEVYEANSRKAWLGIYDQWVERSFTALAELLPGRYAKEEQRVEVFDAIH